MVYNCQGEEISPDGHGLPPQAVYLSMDEDCDPWDFYMQLGQMWNVRHDTVTKQSNAADTTLLVQLAQALHLHCTLLPYRILTIEKMEEVVDLVLELEYISMSPDGKVGFAN